MNLKKKLIGFRLIEIEKGRETEVCSVRLHPVLEFRPRTNCDYIAEAVYEEEDELHRENSWNLP